MTANIVIVDLDCNDTIGRYKNESSEGDDSSNFDKKILIIFLTQRNILDK